MQKKIFCTVLSLCAMLLLLTFAAGAYEFTTVEKDGKTWSQISTAEDLVNLMNDPTKWGSKSAFVNYVLTTDIDLSTYTGPLKQHPIGNQPDTERFRGTFDGAGFEISGLDMSREGFVGLFGYVVNAEIKDLTVSGQVSATGNYAGGIVGVSFGSVTIDNCVNKCTVSAPNSNYVGGIIGFANLSGLPSGTYAVVIRDSVNEGDVIGKSMVGGIAGRFECTSANKNLSATFEGCTNNGDVAADASAEHVYVGGIIGISTVGASGKTAGCATQISGCVNNGAVSGNAVGEYFAYTGGMVGYLRAWIPDLQTVTECVNNGDITSPAYVGGITGYGYAVAGGQTIEKCVNTGTLTATGTTQAEVGGIAGISWNTSVDNCLNTGEVVASAKRAGGLIGRVNGYVYAYTVSGNVNLGAVTAPGGTESVAAIVGDTEAGIPSDGMSPSKGMYAENNYYTEGAADPYGTQVDPAAIGSPEQFAGLDKAAWILTVDGPELRAFHEHDGTVRAVSVSDTQHQWTCSCFEYTGGEVENHAFNAEKVCTVCGYTQSACPHTATHNVITVTPTCTVEGKANKVCDTCSQTVQINVSLGLDANNHKGKALTLRYNAAENCAEYVCAGCSAVVYKDTALAADVYVKQDGIVVSGDKIPTASIGTTEETAFADFAMAMEYAAASVNSGNEDVTVHIVDSAAVGANYGTPEFTGGVITVTGGELNFNERPRRFFLNGDVTFEHMTFKTNATDGMSITAQNHALVLGEGLVMGNAGTLPGVEGYGFPAINNVKMYVVGGYENDAHEGKELNTNITVRSGNYWFVGGWNRGTGSTNYGTSHITVGKTDPADELTINFFVPFSTGNQYISKESTATVIVDGDATIMRPFVGTQNGATADVMYVTNYVLKGNINPTPENQEFNGGRGIDINSNTAAKKQTVNVYVDMRVDTAVADSYVFFGEPGGAYTADTTLENIGAIVNNYTYAQYCETVLGGHFDTNADNFCDECGADLACKHTSTHQVTVTVPTCSIEGFANVVCDDCQMVTQSNVSLGFDPDNHAGKALTLRYSAEERCVEYVCAGCGAVVYKDTALKTDVYVKQDGIVPSGDNVPTSPIGTTEATAFADFAMAMEYAAASVNAGNENVTVHIVDSAVVGARYATPEFTGGVITVTGGELNFNTQPRRFYLNGDVTFERMTFKTNATDGMLIFAQNHALVLGEGIVMGNAGTLKGVDGFPEINNVKMYVMGGFEGDAGDGKELNTNVTVRSGSYWYIGGWNRQAPSANKNSGTANLTIGKTNPDDELLIHYVVPFSTGTGYISAESEATVVLDGDAEIMRLYATTQNEVTADIMYTTNFVLKGDVNPGHPEFNNGLGIDVNAQPAAKMQTVNVYTDARVETAVIDSYAFFGNSAAALEPDPTLNTIGAIVNKYTYVDYCIRVLGGHVDENHDNLCDECGTDALCNHESFTEEITTPPTCTEPGVKTFTCKDCLNTPPYSYTEQILPLGHDLVLVTAEVPKTCTTPGTTAVYKCQRAGCEHVEGGEVIPAGHTFGEWVVTKPAKPGVKGEESRTCSDCGFVEKREIAALPKDEGNRNLIALVVGQNKAEFTVRFSTVGAAKIESQTVKKGNAAAKPEDPVKLGFYFAGWYRDARYETPYDFAAPVTEDLTLFAKWETVDPRIVMTVGSIDVSVFGMATYADVPPVIVNNRTMLPARFVAEALGGVVTWNADERKVTIISGETGIELYIDSTAAYIDGREVTLDSAPFIRDDRTYLPLRFIAEALGAKVDWYPESGKIVLTRTEG